MFLLCLLQFQNILIANSEKTLLLYFLSFNHSKQYIKKITSGLEKKDMQFKQDNDGDVQFCYFLVNRIYFHPQ